MDDALLVCRLEPRGDPGGDRQRLFDRQRASGDALGKRLSIVVREHEIQLAIVRFTDLVQRRDIRMVEYGNGPGLRFQAAFRLGSPGQVLRKELQGHVSAEPAVAGQVDDSHPAAPELPLDDERPHLGISRKCRGRCGQCSRQHVGGALERRVGQVRAPDHRIEFGPQLIVSLACLGDERLPVARRELEHRIQQAVDPLPTIGVEVAGSHLSSEGGVIRGRFSYAVVQAHRKAAEELDTHSERPAAGATLPGDSRCTCRSDSRGRLSAR